MSEGKEGKDNIRVFSHIALGSFCLPTASSLGSLSGPLQLSSDELLRITGSFVNK